LTTLEAAGRADGFEVLEEHADDFAEAQGDDGEVIAPEAQRGDAHPEADGGGHQSAQDQRDQEHRRLCRRRHDPRQGDGDRGGGVAAHRHEARVAEAELAGVAVDEVKADGEDDVDADVNDDAEVVAVELAGAQRHHGRHREGGEQKPFGAGEPHTFSACGWPSSPAGLKSRIRIRIANAMPSR
jgi:hypothetical protein